MLFLYVIVFVIPSLWSADLIDRSTGNPIMRRVEPGKQMVINGFLAPPGTLKWFAKKDAGSNSGTVYFVGADDKVIASYHHEGTTLNVSMEDNILGQVPQGVALTSTSSVTQVGAESLNGEIRSFQDTQYFTPVLNGMPVPDNAVGWSAVKVGNLGMITFYDSSGLIVGTRQHSASEGITIEYVLKNSLRTH